MKPRLVILGLVPVLLLCGCATVLDEDGALAVAPYDVIDPGHVVVEVDINGHGPYQFALDTGASISAVFGELRDELALEPIPDKDVIIHGVVASGRFPLVRVGQIGIGGEVWQDPRIVALPGGTTISKSIDGILGVDFLRRYAVGFSSRERVIRLYPPELISERSYRGWSSVTLEPEYVGGSGAAVYFFDIRIGDEELSAMFDLGASINMINWSAARNLGLDPEDLRDTDALSGALDTTEHVARITVDELRTGRIRWQDELFTVTEFEFITSVLHRMTPCAILGAGLFIQRDFIIDFERNRLLVNVAMSEADDIRPAPVTPP